MFISTLKYIYNISYMAYALQYVVLYENNSVVLNPESSVPRTQKFDVPSDS
jgi:hypothetical protein